MRLVVEDCEIFMIKWIVGFNFFVFKDVVIMICVVFFFGKEIDFVKWIICNIRELERKMGFINFKWLVVIGYVLD